MKLVFLCKQLDARLQRDGKVVSADEQRGHDPRLASVVNGKMARVAVQCSLQRECRVCIRPPEAGGSRAAIAVYTLADFGL